MGIIEEIKNLANTISEDVKVLKSEKASKEDMDKALVLLDGIASAIRKSEVNEEFKNSLLSKAIVKAIGSGRFVPFKEINEKNFETFVRFIRSNVRIPNPTTEFKGRVFALLKDGQTTVTIKLDDKSIASGYKLKVVCTKDGERIETITNKEFTVINPTNCKYYMFKTEDVVEIEFCTVYLKELEKHDNVMIEMKEESDGRVTITKLVDNNDYDIYDLSNHGMYIQAIEKQFKTQFPNKDYNSTDIVFIGERIEINGQIKILKLHRGNVGLEPKVGIKIEKGYGDQYVFKNNPKYVAVYSLGSEVVFLRLIGPVFMRSSGRLSPKVNANSFIAKFSSEDSKNKKYTNVTLDSLEDWLKTNPLETL